MPAGRHLSQIALELLQGCLLRKFTEPPRIDFGSGDPGIVGYVSPFRIISLRALSVRGRSPQARQIGH